MEKHEEKVVKHRGSKIHAFKYKWKEKNDKGKEVDKSQVVCHLYRAGSKNQPLNLGEMSDGSSFTAVAQSVNEAKKLIDMRMTLAYLKEYGRDVMGVGEYVKEGRKWVFKTVEGLRVWKCENRYYFVKDGEVSLLTNSVLDK